MSCRIAFHVARQLFPSVNDTVSDQPGGSPGGGILSHGSIVISDNGMSSQESLATSFASRKTVRSSTCCTLDMIKLTVRMRGMYRNSLPTAVVH